MRLPGRRGGRQPGGRRQRPPRRFAVVLCHPEAAWVALRRGPELEELGWLHFEGADMGPEPGREAATIRRQLSRSRLPVVLRLPATAGLRTVERLPAGASGEVEAIMRHRIDVLTPYRPDQVASAVEVLETTPEGEIEVALTVVPRSDIDACLARLRPLELKPAWVDVAGEERSAPPTVNLLDDHPPQPGWGHGRGARAGAALVALLALAGAVVGGARLWERELELAENERALARLEAEAADLAPLRQEFARLRRRAEAVTDLRRETGDPLRVLERLSQLLPDDAWLERLELGPSTVELEGYAANATALVERIDADPAFAEARLTAPVTRSEPGVRPGEFDSFTLMAEREPPQNTGEPVP